MKKECIAMLLAGGQGSRLYVLTGDMAKPAVPFGGKFRIIDFPLSNFRSFERLYGLRYIIPENATFATAIGAALCSLRAKGLE